MTDVAVVVVVVSLVAVLVGGEGDRFDRGLLLLTDRLGDRDRDRVAI